MKIKSIIHNILLGAVLILTFSVNSYAGGGGSLQFTESTTDASESRLYSFFDLRDRETFVQMTNTQNQNILVHVQIFNVADNCNENNFFDNFTPNDTHTYNMRDILTNDTNPSGVVLPVDAYGFVYIARIDEGRRNPNRGSGLIGNFRIVDNLGYEYRTNSAGDDGSFYGGDFGFPLNSFNFNKEAGVVLSDIVGIVLIEEGVNCPLGEVCASNLVDSFVSFDIDIYNLNEVPFSCRNVIFACIDNDNPRLEELLEFVGTSSVASFEYGINDAIPHSKGGELLCPANNIEDGIVTLQTITSPPNDTGTGLGYSLFVGLNNGNGRGSMDYAWTVSPITSEP